MSTVNVEAAVEALEKKIEQVKIVDEKAGEESTNENSVESKHEKRSRRKPRIPDDERRRQWEEEQKDKPVIETGVKGQVKWYSVLGHYGFISRADGKKDVFVHQSAIAKSHTIKFYLRTLADDEEVLFDVVEGSQGLEAANVSGPDGTEVKGSRYQNVLLRRRFLNNRFSRNRKDRHENSDKSEKTKDGAEGDVKKRHRRPRRYSKKTASENGAHEDGAEEVKEGEPKARSSPRKNRHQRRNRRRSENGEKKAAEGDRESESEKSQKPGARRRKDSEGAGKTEVRCGSALANGDARLGAEKVDGQV